MQQLLRPPSPSAHPRHPKLRRHTSSGLGSFFKNTLGNAFLSFFEDSAKLKPSLKDNQQTIKSNFKKINDIIDSVDEHIKKRMQNYQNEVFDIIKDEIRQMKVETEKLVQQLNKKIAEKNVHSELWHIKNELDYFKIQALKLFQENKGYRIELKMQTKTIKDLKIDIDCQDQLLQKLRKKFLKEKLKSQRGQISSSQVKKNTREDLFLTQTFGIPKSRREISKSQNPLKQQANDLSIVQDKVQEQSLIDIRLSNNNNIPNHVALLLDQQSIQNPRESSVPSLQFRDSMLSNQFKDLPSVKMAKVESYLDESAPVFATKSKFKDASVQTDPTPILKNKVSNKKNASNLQFEQISNINLTNNQAVPQKQLMFSNRFSFNRSTYHKPKHQQLQQSMRQRQTLRMRTEIQPNQPMSMRYMSNALIKNRLQDMDIQGKRRNKPNISK